MKTFLVAALSCLTLPCSLLSAAEKPSGLPEGYELLYEQRFASTNAWSDFVFTDAKAWRFATIDQDGALELVQQSNYKPPFRSPVNLGLISGKVFGNFTLDVDLKQTGREYGHRDMCLFFGFVDASHFYYAHLATAADDNAHNIFIVDGAPRTKIAEKTTKGVDWGLNVTHKVRLERRADAIRVYFDDMTTPIMEAKNSKFAQGYIGFGSFDDTGAIDNIRIWGDAVESKNENPFPQRR